MSIAFSLAIYVVVGVAACAWLESQARLPSGILAHVTAVLVWPAYLPASLAAGPRDSSARREARARARDPAFASVRRQLQRMPLDPARRREHLAVIGGLERAFIARLDRAQRRHSILVSDIDAWAHEQLHPRPLHNDQPRPVNRHRRW